MREGRLDGLPFQLQTSSSETTTCNTIILWAWVIRNQWLWALLSLSIHWEKRERSKILTRLHSCFVLWRSLNWLNGWGKENIFGVDCWDGCTQKQRGERNAAVWRKGVLVWVLRMILLKIKGGKLRWKLTEVEERIVGGDCSNGSMHN